jgi:hypothetical protein
MNERISSFLSPSHSRILASTAPIPAVAILAQPWCPRTVSWAYNSCRFRRSTQHLLGVAAGEVAVVGLVRLKNAVVVVNGFAVATFAALFVRAFHRAIRVAPVAIFG